MRLPAPLAVLLPALFALAAAASATHAQLLDVSGFVDAADLPPGLCLPSWSSPFGAEPGLGPDTFGSEVYGAVVYDDGLGGGPALYVGGDFLTAGGVPAPHVARWDGSTWSDVGGGVNGRVFDLAVADFLGGPVLIVGGTFTEAGGVACENLARWDGTSWSAESTSTNGAVHCLYTLKGAPVIADAVIVGGAFTSIGGSSSNRIAIFTGTGFIPFGAGFDAQVSDVTEHAGALYAGGIFGASGATPIERVARWNGAAWEAVDGGTPGPGATVTCLASFDDGSGPALYVGGVFVLPGSFGSLGRWRDGVGWDAPGGGVGSGAVTDLRVWDDGGGADLYVAGLALTTGALANERVLRWDGASWSPLGSAFDFGFVRTLVSFDDGSGSVLYALGQFFAASGLAAKGAARWDGAAWSAFGPAGLTDGPLALCSSDVNGAPALYVAGRHETLFATGVVGQGGILGFQGGAWFGLGDVDGGIHRRVYDLVAHDDGSGSKLYAGGDFTSVGGVPAGNIACWDGVSWSPVGGGTDEAVTDLYVWDDGSGPALYAGGMFAEAGGTPALGIAKWDGQDWSPLAGGMGPDIAVLVGAGTEVHDMAAYDDGSGEALYVTGRFGAGTWAPSAPGDGIARWDGAAWSAVGTGLGFGPFSAGEGRALAVYDDGGGKRLFVGGNFDDAGGVGVQNLAAYDGAWHALPGGTFNSTIDALAVYDQGGGSFLGSKLLHIGGLFSNVGGNAIVKAARWDGVAFTSLGGGLLDTAGGVTSFAVHDLGDGAGPQLAVGGFFSTVAGLLPQPASHLALWGGCWTGVNAWVDLGFALAGLDGDPLLVGDGSLALGSVNDVVLTNAAGSALAGLFLSFSSTPTPFAGGTLVPVPWLDPIILTLPASGSIALTYTVAECLPSGIPLYVQWVIQDGAAIAGYALSNAVVGTTP